MSKTSHWNPCALACALLALLVAAALPRAARADDDDPVAKITQLNRDALGAYQAKKFDDARKLLKQALDIAAASGLDQHPIKARTYIHMGVVLLNGFKQRDAGLKQFRKAIEIQADIQLTKNLVTPDLQAAFDEAKSSPEQAESPPPAEPPAAAPPSAAPAQPDVPSGGLVHEAVTESKQGSAISISVSVQSDLKFEKLVLAYRPAGAAEFLGRQMKEVSEGTYSAEIPTSATGGKTVAYYIEAEDKEGGAVAARGSADSPLTISLVGSRSAAVAHKSGDEDGDEDDEEEDEGGGGPKIYVAVMGGWGFGWASGNGDTNADTMIKPAGIAPSSTAQISPEVGYALRKNLMLSLQGRFQTISGTTDIYRTDANNRTKIYHAANYAAAVFARATWRFGEHAFRPFVSVAAGGGQIRHVVTFKQVKDCGPMHNLVCVDTIATGPVLVGPGAGFSWGFNDHLGLVAQINTQLAIPDFAFNVDFNAGMAMMF